VVCISNGMERRPRLPATGLECRVNLDVLNRYVLGAIVLFALCLYIAMLKAGFSELGSRLPKARTRKRRLRNLRTSRRWRNEKSSPGS
jgi:hypothetical protein